MSKKIYECSEWTGYHMNMTCTISNLCVYTCQNFVINCILMNSLELTIYHIHSIITLHILSFRFNNKNS